MALLTPALGISSRQLRDLTDDGLLPFINVGRRKKRPARRYEPADIERLDRLVAAIREALDPEARG
jgi:DNA-binding transcriptional MerR regulator